MPSSAHEAGQHLSIPYLEVINSIDACNTLVVFSDYLIEEPSLSEENSELLKRANAKYKALVTSLKKRIDCAGEV